MAVRNRAELDWAPVVAGVLVGIQLVGRDPPIHRGLRGRRGSGAGGAPPNLQVKFMTAGEPSSLVDLLGPALGPPMVRKGSTGPLVVGPSVTCDVFRSRKRRESAALLPFSLVAADRRW